MQLYKQTMGVRACDMMFWKSGDGKMAKYGQSDVWTLLSQRALLRYSSVWIRLKFIWITSITVILGPYLNNSTYFFCTFFYGLVPLVAVPCFSPAPCLELHQHLLDIIVSWIHLDQSPCLRLRWFQLIPQLPQAIKDQLRLVVDETSVGAPSNNMEKI